MAEDARRPKDPRRAHDAMRPRLHFAPARGWMNDPNGLCYVDGWYHLFFQHDPDHSRPVRLHWGHARSRDLLTWEELPVALVPDTDGGEQHCFSGCAVVESGAPPRLFYTSIGEEEGAVARHARQRVAEGSRDLISWPRERRRTVLETGDPSHPAGEIRDWRDPAVVRHGDQWLMVVGGRYDRAGAVFLYVSDDGETWTYRRVLYRLGETPSLIECPSLFTIGDTWVLLFSPDGPVEYVAGSLSPDLELRVRAHGIVDGAGWQGFYAPQVWRNPGPSPVMIGWVTEESRRQSADAGEWDSAGAMSLPRVLHLDADSGLRQDFHPVLERARRRSLSVDRGMIDLPEDGAPIELCLELDLPADAAEQGNIAVTIDHDEHGDQQTEIVLSPALSRLRLLRERSTRRAGVDISSIDARLPAIEYPLALRIVLDGTLLEVLAGGRVSITSRVYPVSDRHYRAAVDAGAWRVRRIGAWTLSRLDVGDMLGEVGEDHLPVAGSEIDP